MPATQVIGGDLLPHWLQGRVSEDMIITCLPKQAIYDMSIMIANTRVFGLTHHPFRLCLHEILTECIRMRASIRAEREANIFYRISDDCFYFAVQIEGHIGRMRELIWMSKREYECEGEGDGTIDNDDDVGELSMGEIWAGGIPGARVRSVMFRRCDQVIDRIFDATANESYGTLRDVQKIFAMLRKIQNLSNTIQFLLSFSTSFVDDNMDISDNLEAIGDISLNSDTSCFMSV